MPVQNKACNQRYIKRCQERHRQKVSSTYNTRASCEIETESRAISLRVIFSPHILLTNLSSSFSTFFFSASTSLFQLRDMKCSIDNKGPRQATYLNTKAKKNALVEDRINQIETENRILLEKMTHIMRVSTCTNVHTFIVSSVVNITSYLRNIHHNKSKAYLTLTHNQSHDTLTVQRRNKFKERKHEIRPFTE